MNVDVNNEDMVHLVELLKNSHEVMFIIDEDLICDNSEFNKHSQKTQKSLSCLKKSGRVNVLVRPPKEGSVGIYVDVVEDEYD